MKKRSMFKLSWRNVWRNPWRSFSIIAAMSLGLLGVLMIMAFSNGMTLSMINNAIDSELGHIQIHNPEYLQQASLDNSLSSEQLLSLQTSLDSYQYKGEQLNYSARLSIPAMMATANRSRGIRIQGVNPMMEAKTTNIEQLLSQGIWLNDSQKKPIVISERNAKRLNARLKSKIIVTYSNSNAQVAGTAFRVVGIFQSGSSMFDDGYAFVLQSDLSSAVESHLIQEIAIRLPPSAPLNQFQSDLQQHFNAQLSIQRWDQRQPMLATMIQATAFSNAIILTIFVCAMGFGIINVMLMVVFERTREFGVLLAIGMQSRMIATLLLLESSLLACVSTSIAGLLCLAFLSYFGRYGLDLGQMAQGLNAFGSNSLIYPQLEWLQFCYSAASVIVVAIIAALVPARRLFKLAPHTAMAERH
ncbi:ABC transporter permease [Alginatibacterium sediminis]|uniref:ABC transporter permease n=1 Tax=Alginatibacterium sediminis TaxID=2164068 RepID=A0A420E6J7_9ALTE|nr:ABC transporter permease [Alginatibacterium sediminis]RKF13287.1 ABC transporter permease [Alginatibacterium sediminis]